MLWFLYNLLFPVVFICMLPKFISRMLKRLRTHGIVKQIGRTYKYYLTQLGRQVVITALKLRRFVIIPSLSTLEPIQ